MAVVGLLTESTTSEQQLKGETMVQVFMVVRCFSCEIFQVQQVKKSNKWICKVCNEKQSVLKTYGRGSAPDCRKHVQKLNMMRAEKEKKEPSPSNHPPEDYASTFTTDDLRLGVHEIPEHPVLLTSRTSGKSKWTTFIEPKDEEEEEVEDTYTTDRAVFQEAKKARKQVKRSSSARRPHTRTQNVVSHSNVTGSEEKIYPYSSVSHQMEGLLDAHTERLTSSKSLYALHPDRYRKIEQDSFPCNHIPSSSQSMYDLSSDTNGSVRPTTHKDNMARIKEDISRYSRVSASRGSFEGTSMGQPSDDQIIPKASSKWSQFMCQEDSEEEDSEGGVTAHTFSQANQL